ncbi:UPF0764 protein C16orf89-like protein [Aphelenchoides fujianensis]|nr:UPF0764 protein C16orf89-like protein [Aphelenchoides fujianensis]
MPSLPPIQWLSWNNARLMALLLNALTGLLNFFEGDVQELSLDSLYALRIQQLALHDLNARFSSGGIHREVFASISNLSRRADRLIERGMDHWAEREPQMIAEGRFFFDADHQWKAAAYRRLDERWRWASKTGVRFGSDKREFFDEDGKGRLFECLREFRSCADLSPVCLRTFTIDGEQPQRPAAPVVEQLVFLGAAEVAGCSPEVGAFVANQTAGRKAPRDAADLAADLCTNFADETAKLRKDRRRLARADFAQVRTIAEQIALCGRLGFAEVVDPHVLETLLAWQQPGAGFYARTRPEPVPRHGVVDAFGLEDTPDDSKRTGGEQKSGQFSSLAAQSLVVALRLLLDPPEWPELRLHDQELLVQMHQIAAEDRFQSFRYVEWVRDAHLPSDLRMRPPPHAWSPDLIAFVCLAFIFVAGSVVAHMIFSKQYRPGVGPRPHNAKQFYMYAYKKL